MIAVTGANGLLGSFIVRELIHQNLPFVAFKRPDSDVTLLSDVAGSITWKDVSITDPITLDESLDGVTEVIHAAAIVSFDPRDKRRMFETNVDGTRNVVNACLAHRVKKLVHISSVAALGRVKGQEVITEKSKWVESPLNSTYAQSKYAAELEVYRGIEEGLNATILNPSVILAPADWTKSSAKLFHYVWKQNRFYIDNDLNFVDVRDVATIAVKMLKAEDSGERFTISAGRTPIVNFFSGIASRFGKKPPTLRVNRRVLNIIAWVERLRSAILGGEPLITRETARLANTHFLYANDKIRQKLNFEFRSLDETLDWCCRYYINLPPAKK